MFKNKNNENNEMSRQDWNYNGNDFFSYSCLEPGCPCVLIVSEDDNSLHTIYPPNGNCMYHCENVNHSDDNNREFACSLHVNKYFLHTKGDFTVCRDCYKSKFVCMHCYRKTCVSSDNEDNEHNTTNELCDTQNCWCSNM